MGEGEYVEGRWNEEMKTKEGEGKWHSPRVRECHVFGANNEELEH